jgi:hypothetical protein
MVKIVRLWVIAMAAIMISENGRLNPFFRKIKIMKDRRQFEFLNHATTIWLASEESKPANNNGLLPFGWAVMEVV